VIVIKLPENELLALVGSPNPQSFEEGYQINMLLQPRAIGSTVKPFIYLKAFEKGLRPYTLVDDREYKYITAIGFPLYPKNFDYKYRGIVNLHYALSNSLNVPAVKVLEYVGLEDFYNFLQKDLEFRPVQNLDNYQLGIALGALEMSLFDLARYFTIFPNKGVLKEIRIFKNNENPTPEKQIADLGYIQLINKILNDRRTGIEQFGLRSELDLFQKNYALKTGTSRNFRDSWVIGYTPDFLVGVWVGNSDNTPMQKITGQTGAGRIWAEVMEILFNSEYNKKTPFEFDLIKEFSEEDNNIEYGLASDNYEKSLHALIGQDSGLILVPHQGDVFLLEDGKPTKIILKAKENVRWFVNNLFLAEGQKTIFIPKNPGSHQIKAQSLEGLQEAITIFVHQ
jgi:membrane carboxypeptidase/penicillin-binding protein PbpC